MTFPHRPRRAPWLGRTACAVFLVLASAACATDRGTGGGALADQPLPIGSTLTGNYLAARHAQTANRDAAAAEFLLAALEKAPADPMLLERAHRALLMDGRTDQAVAIARRIVAGPGGGELAFLTLAVDDIKNGRYRDAERTLKAAPGGSLGSFLAPILRAWTLQGEGRTDDALAMLRPLKDDDRFSSLYHLHAGLLNDAANRPAAALAHARALADANDITQIRLAEIVGGLYERAGKPDEARAVYAELDKRGPAGNPLSQAWARLESGTRPAALISSPAGGVADAMYYAASTLSHQGARDVALMVAALGLHAKPNHPLLRMQLGDLLEQVGRLEDAAAAYAAIDRASPVSWQARLNHAAVLDAEGQSTKAENELRAMAADRPDNAEPLIVLGDIFRQREQFADAVVVYDEAVKRSEPLPQRYWRVLYARGIALERSKQWPRAEADFLRALEFEPDQPLVLNYLGYSWVERGENLDKAQDMIRRAVELRPNDGFIVDSLGWVYYRLGKYPEAVVQLERAVELRSEDPVINAHLGDAYWAVGRQREARYQWRTALDLEPDAELGAELQRKLDGVIKEANAGSR